MVKQKKVMRPRWTESEIKILKKLYKTQSNEFIAQQLNRKVSSVVFKAFTMNLKKGKKRLRVMGVENISHRDFTKKNNKGKKKAA